MRFVFAVLLGLLVCGVIGNATAPHLPDQWGWIIGGLMGAVAGWKLYQWSWRL